MVTQERATGRVRQIAGAAATLILTGTLALSVAEPVAAVPPPPPNPSDQQIEASENQASTSAEQVGKLAGKLSSTQTKIQQLQDAMELKAELAMKAQVDLSMAQDEAADAARAAQDAEAAAADAGDAIEAAREDAAEFAAASFRQGHVIGSMTALVNVDSMDQLVARQQMIDQVSGSQRGVIATLHTALATKANLDSKAKAALEDAKAAQAKAEDAKKTADAAKVAAAKSFKQGQQQLEALEKQLTEQQDEYQAALNTVADLKGQRQQYNAWLQAKQEEDQRLQQEAQLQAQQTQDLRDQQRREQRLDQQQEAAQDSAVSAEKKRQKKIREEEERRAREKAEREAREKAAREKAARERAARQNSGSSGSSGSSAPSRPSPPSSSSSLSRGERVVQAALAYLGTTYAWGGGNRYGPTRGIHDGGIADYYQDYNRIGFDCSGLALYAWAQVGVYLPHYSAYQFNYGTRISRSNLQPGDLVFFATNVYNPATIHHVAIYIGNGQMVEAPQSGSVVRVRSLRTSGYIGATRPGT